MEPREFLRKLMERSGDNPNSLSSKLNKKTAQPQIHKFLTGIANEPRRSTLKPIADFYKVSLEAFYSSAIAEQEFRRINDFEVTAKDGSKTVLEVKTPSQINERRAAYRVITIEEAISRLATQIEEIDQSEKPAVKSLLESLVNSPGLHEIVSQGLKQLRPNVRGDPSKQRAPAQSS